MPERVRQLELYLLDLFLSSDTGNKRTLAKASVRGVLLHAELLKLSEAQVNTLLAEAVVEGDDMIDCRVFVQCIAPMLIGLMKLMCEGTRSWLQVHQFAQLEAFCSKANKKRKLQDQADITQLQNYVLQAEQAVSRRRAGNISRLHGSWDLQEQVEATHSAKVRRIWAEARPDKYPPAAAAGEPAIAITGKCRCPPGSRFKCTASPCQPQPEAAAIPAPAAGETVPEPAAVGNPLHTPPPGELPNVSWRSFDSLSLCWLSSIEEVGCGAITTPLQVGDVVAVCSSSNYQLVHLLLVVPQAAPLCLAGILLTESARDDDSACSFQTPVGWCSPCRFSVPDDLLIIHSLQPDGMFVVVVNGYARPCHDAPPLRHAFPGRSDARLCSQFTVETEALEAVLAVRFCAHQHRVRHGLPNLPDPEDPGFSNTGSIASPGAPPLISDRGGDGSIVREYNRLSACGDCEEDTLHFARGHWEEGPGLWFALLGSWRQEPASMFQTLRQRAAFMDCLAARATVLAGKARDEHLRQEAARALRSRAAVVEAPSPGELAPEPAASDSGPAAVDGEGAGGGVGGGGGGCGGSVGGCGGGQVSNPSMKLDSLPSMSLICKGDHATTVLVGDVIAVCDCCSYTLKELMLVVPLPAPPWLAGIPLTENSDAVQGHGVNPRTFSVHRLPLPGMAVIAGPTEQIERELPVCELQPEVMFVVNGTRGYAVRDHAAPPVRHAVPGRAVWLCEQWTVDTEALEAVLAVHFLVYNACLLHGTLPSLTELGRHPSLHPPGCPVPGGDGSIVREYNLRSACGEEEAGVWDALLGGWVDGAMTQTLLQRSAFLDRLAARAGFQSGEARGEDWRLAAAEARRSLAAKLEARRCRAEQEQLLAASRARAGSTTPEKGKGRSEH